MMDSGSLVGMTQGARKRLLILVSQHAPAEYAETRAYFRMGQRLRPCPLCRWRRRFPVAACEPCGSSGILPARYRQVRK